MADDNSSLDEELIAQENEDDENNPDYIRQQEEFAAMQQIDRRRQQIEQEQSKKNQLVDAGKGFVKDQAKTMAKKQAWSFLAATSEFWAPALGILLIIGVVLGLFFFVITTAIAYCNSNDTPTWIGAQIASKASWAMGQGDFCKTLAINQNTAITNAPTLPQPSGEPGDLVFLEDFGIPVKPDIDSRVTRCMVGKIRAIYDASQAAGIEWEISDAFRPGGATAGGGVSAHSRGEAVDIALRNPTAPLQSNDPRITQLVTIARNAGFIGPSGDTLDEYRNPAPNATGGHVHVEYNIPPNGGTYCQL